jgi:hypothetical protein
MSRNLRNVTVTLDEETARWARLEAARRDTSVSRLLGEILKREMEGQGAYEAAMSRYHAQSPSVHRAPARPLPRRDELHDRTRLR